MSDQNYTQLVSAGPFKGLNKVQTPIRRNQAPGPNAAPPQYATEWKNLKLDPATGAMVSRPGTEGRYEDICELGISTYNNYDEDLRPRPEVVMVSKNGFRALRIARTSIEPTGASVKFSLYRVEGTDNVRTVVTDLNGVVLSDSTNIGTTLASSINTNHTEVNLSLTDLEDSRNDWNLITLSDLFEIIEKTVDAKKEVSGVVLNTIDSEYSLSGYDLTSKEAKVANFVEMNNVLYIALNDTPLLKYNGEYIEKAGLPDYNKIGIDLGSLENAYLLETIGTHEVPWALSTSPLHTHASTNVQISQSSGIVFSAAVFTANFKGLFNKAADTFDPEAHKSYYAARVNNQTIAGNSYVAKPGNGGLSQFISQDETTGRIIHPVYGSSYFGINNGLRSGGLHCDSVNFLEFPRFGVNKGWRVRGASIFVNQYHMIKGRTGPFYDQTGQPLVAQDIADANAELSVSVTQENLKGNEPDDTDLIFHAVLFASVKEIGLVNSNTPVSGEITISGPTTVTETHLIHIPVLIKAKYNESASNTTTIVFKKDIEVHPGVTGLNEVTKVNTNWFDIVEDVTASVFADEVFDPISYVGKKLEDLDVSALGISIPRGGISKDIMIDIYRHDAQFNTTREFEGFDSEIFNNANFNRVMQMPNDPFGNIRVYEGYQNTLLGAAYEGVSGVDIFNEDDDSTSTLEHSPIPKGNIITEHKSRVYIADGINTISASSVVLGPEQFNADKSESLELSTDTGDQITGIAPLSSALAILKENSVFIAQGDFATNTIRIDEIASKGFGCLNHASIAEIKDGIAYLSAEGVVYLGYNQAPSMMGSIYSTKISRIRDKILDENLDLTKAIAFNDTAQEQYLLHIPLKGDNLIGLDSKQDPGAGLTLVYDYMNDAWYEYTNYNFASGSATLDTHQFLGTSFGVGSGDRNSVLMKVNGTGSLRDYRDAVIDVSGNLTNQHTAILEEYQIDWQIIDNPSILKKWLRIKAYAINAPNDVNILGLTNDFTLLINCYKDWRDDSLHSSGKLKLDGKRLTNRMKLRPQTSVALLANFSNNEIYKKCYLQALEIELNNIYKKNSKSWKSS